MPIREVDLFRLSFAKQLEQLRKAFAARSVLNGLVYIQIGLKRFHLFIDQLKDLVHDGLFLARRKHRVDRAHLDQDECGITYSL